MADDTGNVTRILKRYTDGRREALDELLPRVYDELRQIAPALAVERSGASFELEIEDALKGGGESGAHAVVHGAHT